MSRNDLAGSSVILTVEQIKNDLRERFSGLIDMSDMSNRPANQQESKFLSRAVAAFSLVALAGADPRAAGDSITDDFEDGGIDAIYIDAADKAIYFVQSKWSSGGKETISEGDCLKFLQGVTGLFSGAFARFCLRIRNREQEIRKHLLSRSDMRIVLVLAFTSSEPLSREVDRAIGDYLRNQNNVDDREVFSREVMNLSRLYKAIANGGKVRDEISLTEWGTIQEPYRAYYGMMTMQDIGRWHEHDKALFARNIRLPVGETGVNDAIDQTIKTEPAHFWYYNNGITILCDKVTKTHHNGSNRDFGMFVCEGMSVVNGAQTVGVIIDRARSDPAGFAAAAGAAKVSVRLISLEKCPEDFGNQVARATNTQNRIQPINFIAFDDNQTRLAVEMEGMGKRYAFKEGDKVPDGDEGCGAEEASVSLACASPDMMMAVVAKREVGRLWANTSEKPYTDLFNQSVSAMQVWRAVSITRAAQAAIARLNHDDYPRGELVAIHGNRFIQHIVFQDPIVKRFRDPKIAEGELLDRASEITPAVFNELTKLIEEKYPDNYLANLFKNAEKCEALGKALLGTPDFPDGLFWNYAADGEDNDATKSKGAT